MLNYKIHESLWKSEISGKSSTKYVNPDVLKVDSRHHICSGTMFMIVKGHN